MEKFNKFETRLAYLSSYLQMWVNNIIYSPLIICDMDYKLISENQERNIKSVKVVRHPDFNFTFIFSKIP